jgi:acylphosphatase
MPGGEFPARPGEAGEERGRARALISGRVQGVCFRAFTREEAHRLGLHGWVRNLDDGRVELLAEGPRSRVEALLAWCRSGPPYARVEDVDASWEEWQGDLKGFGIRG